MEVIGSGLPNGQWATGIPMNSVSQDDMKWEIEQEFGGGNVKFRANNEWVLDWGAGEEDPRKLVFKGGNIPVQKGRYLVRINIDANTYSFTPVSREN
tara:strand:+ start:9018 stop:9308 length:291 start_codon:yes stop_codon:yes gene_type:complete